MATRLTKKPTAGAGVEVIRAESLSGIPWLVHGFSTRKGGVSEAYGGGALNLGITPEDTREAVERNRKLFFQTIGAQGRGSAVWPQVAMR
ncbi:MAG: laccase domain-containing protein, partial [Terriglobales bacterium]